MNRSSQYKTRHRKTLFSYLESLSGKHVTASDIHHHFQQLGISIGMSTIYRHLERMVNEGLVNQYLMDKTDAACFEYVGLHQDDEKTSCFHFKCETCGKLIHLHCDELELVQGHLLKKHGLDINSLRTVLYGNCSQCMNSSHP